MMSLHLLPQRIRRDLGSVVERGELNTGEVILRWSTRTLPDDYDANVEGAQPARTPQQETVTALIHFVGATTKMVNYLEFQAGDAIVSFESTVQIEGRDELTFVLPDGNVYVMSLVGTKVIEYWDVMIGGEKLSQTVALRRRP